MLRQLHNVEFELTYKKVKNLNLRVRPNGSVAVSAPYRTSPQRVDAFVLKNLPFIQRARQRLAALPPYHTPPDSLAVGESLWLFGCEHPILAGQENKPQLAEGRLLLPTGTESLPYPHRQATTLFKALLQPVLEEFLEHHSPFFLQQYGVRPGGLSCRNMKSRYGSCNIRSGQLTFSTRLVHFPLPATEYVVVHELSHLVVPNHSARFYRVVSAALPDFKERLALFRKAAESPYFSIGGSHEAF